MRALEERAVERGALTVGSDHAVRQLLAELGRQRSKACGLRFLLFLEGIVHPLRWPADPRQPISDRSDEREPQASSARNRRHNRQGRYSFIIARRGARRQAERPSPATAFHDQLGRDVAFQVEEGPARVVIVLRIGVLREVLVEVFTSLQGLC